jgi:hypothetical protein
MLNGGTRKNQTVYAMLTDPRTNRTSVVGPTKPDTTEDDAYGSPDEFILNSAKQL